MLSIGVSVVIDWLFPRKCFGCGKIGCYFCDKCQEEIRRDKRGIEREKKNTEGVVRLFGFDGIIREAIHTIKYEMVTDAVDELVEISVREMEAGFPNLVDYWQRKQVMVVPIPLHWQRENWRGFNQVELIGRKLIESLKLRYDKILVRRTNNKPQANFVDKIREKSKIEFEIVGQTVGIGEVVLFDDVITSGRTMEQASKPLVARGIKVWWWSLAG